MKKKHNFLNRVLIFIFSVVCVAVCVCVAQVFATILTVGSLEISSSSSTEFSNFQVYAISLGAYSTKSIAESNASTFQQKNAGGYILKINGAYYVLASAYEKENDAKLVQENLLEEDITSEIITITFDEVELENVSSTSQEKEFIGSLDIFKVVFLDLYDISVSLDTNVIDNTKAKIQIISVKAEIEEKLEELSKGTTAIDGIYYQIIKNKYATLIDSLSEVKEYEETDGVVLSAKIKYTYLYFLDLAKDLINSLNNEI